MTLFYHCGTKKKTVKHAPAQHSTAEKLLFPTIQKKQGLSADETILVSTFLSMQLIAYAVFYIAGLVLKIRD